MAKGALAHFKVISPALPPLTSQQPSAFLQKLILLYLATESGLGCYNENKLQKTPWFGYIRVA